MIFELLFVLLFLVWFDRFNLDLGSLLFLIWIILLDWVVLSSEVVVEVGVIWVFVVIVVVCIIGLGLCMFLEFFCDILVVMLCDVEYLLFMGIDDVIGCVFV